MGLFGKKEMCSICNTQESSKALMDGHICKSCISKGTPYINIYSLKTYSIDKINKCISSAEINNQRLQIFCPTKKIEKYINFDETNKLWQVPYAPVVFTYDEIISYELLEDGESISKGGLGSAIVGGALFGGVGAVVGGIAGSKKTKTEIKEYRIKIITRNELFPEVYINFLMTGPVKSGSILYNSYKAVAQRIITEFTVITDSLNQQENPVSNNISSADEIMKYKKLCDDGIITQEEFDIKKKQLLGL